jgi:hypothetical protein
VQAQIARRQQDCRKRKYQEERSPDHDRIASLS